MARPTIRSCLACLSKKRLITIARELGLTTAQAEPKDAFVAAIADARASEFAGLLGGLSVAELRAISGAHQLPTSGTKPQLCERLVGHDDAPQASLALDEDGELAQVLARARPSVLGIVPMLEAHELTAILRRLSEQHGITIAHGDVGGVEGVARALADVCDLPRLLGELDRDQLLRIAVRYALTPTSKSSDALIRSLLMESHAEPSSADVEPTTALAPATPDAGVLPRPGELVRARHRSWLVSQVLASDDEPTSTRVDLLCLDDDARGNPLSIFWELELGAARIDPARRVLGTLSRFDPPERFGAYYHALRWSSVTTATSPDAERIQAPFRAGIALMQHQLVPLLKVLALPRANLFIADDVGLGKTVEAGLIIQELLLRQRLDMIVIACPAAICLQWQTEMERRFGLRFELINRETITRIRRERGVGTNPWNCGRRFIVSYQTLRRPEYQESLRAALGERLAKTLLVLDEAHNVAPAGNTLGTAIDSQLTKLARQLAPRFENRLFLSATPHNGHSNSFSALLELLDPTRFTRGVPIEARRDTLDAVMVRRLKRDLIGTSTLAFPRRRLIELRLARESGTWQLESLEADRAHAPAQPLAAIECPSLELSELLAEYEQLCAPTAKRDKRVFIGLQKRLLSSNFAFARTLEVHLARTGVRILERLPVEPAHTSEVPGDEIYGEELDGEIELLVGAAEPLPREPSTRARAEALLERMQVLLRGVASRPEAKLLGVVAWIRANLCPAAGRRWFDTPPRASTRYGTRRLILFTEYADTATYLIKMLRAALADTELEDERIAHFHGAMSDEQRLALQADFNADPSIHPLRILVATDAAREGVNLQAHCADLIHYDIPWNPGRLEQRNGRIDRTLQPSPEVRCMYFMLPQRREDRVLELLVDKVGRIHAELGSLSAVVLSRIEDALDSHGIDAHAQQRLALDDAEREAIPIVEREVESIRPDASHLARELELAADTYARSREFFAPDADRLRETLSMALALAGAAHGGRFEPLDPSLVPPGDPPHHRVPELPPEWARTLDSLRPPRPRDQAPWTWRQATPPKPVVFGPLSRMTDEVVQLHLEHPFVRRALARFTAQGYAAHDLEHATLLRTRGTHERLVVIARLSLLGHTATRLHDGLLHLVAELRGDAPRVLEREREIADTLADMREAMHEAASWQPAAAFVKRHLERLPGDLALLWPMLEREAEHEARELTRRLDDRGAREATQLREILVAQRRKITTALLTMPDDLPGNDPATRQRRLDRKHMQDRCDALARELDSEPERLREHYRVASKRIELVGVAVLVPATR